MAGLLRTIAVVGGGFSGTLIAANLLRHSHAEATRLILIERSAGVGRGIAYAERDFPYLLNVPAGRMSANSRAPLEFLHFVQQRIPAATAEDFLPRALYGDYLQEMLLTAQLNAPHNIRLETWQGHVTNVRRLERHLPLQVELQDGRRITADDVVLACGNPPPATLPALAPLVDHPAYVTNPWAQEMRFAHHESVLLIGTGLTMADVVNAVGARAGAVAQMHAISRHGLLPPRQTPFQPEAFRGDGNALLFAAARSLRGLVAAVRLLASEAERCGGDWREAVTFVRHMAPTLWMRMPESDRRRFLRHLRAQWDVHRHRLPAEVLQRIDEVRHHGRLHIHAGRIERAQERAGRIDVTWRPRGAAQSRTLSVDKVVNCTGPDYAIARSPELLWRNLVQCGLCVPDALELGLRTGPNGAIIDADGWPGPHLFYVGPMLRADHWEATAVAELRTHAERLGALLASTGHSGSARR